MNGATAEPSVKTIKVPKRMRTVMTGSNQNFLRSLRKVQNSVRKSIILSPELKIAAADAKPSAVV